MNPDFEQRLGQFTPRGTDPEERDRLLGAVARELAASENSSWQRRCRWVAAALLGSVVLNLWAVQADKARLARLLGPPPVPRPVAEVARAVEGVTDKETAQWVERQCLAAEAEQAVAAPPWAEMKTLKQAAGID
jgi:hypothetical protein